LKQKTHCEIWGFHSCEDSDRSVLGYDTV